MPETDSTYVAADTTEVRPRRFSRRLILGSILLLAILLMALLPPLINVNRFQRSIVTSISASLGRPVHLDNVSMTLLPFPGFTLENLVVEEDPAFGNEPVISASTVQARCASALSGVSASSSPLSASPTPASTSSTRPTAAGIWRASSSRLARQRRSHRPAQGRPRAALPLHRGHRRARQPQMGQAEDRPSPSPTPTSPSGFLIPSSGTFASRPSRPHRHQRLRYRHRPPRRHVGRAASLRLVPLHLEADWRSAPLGEASRLLLGRDAGLRGEGFLSANLDGTVGSNAIQTRLRLDAVRRADFVPEHTIAVDLECQAKATEAFHAFQDVRCSWPPAAESDKGSIALTASLPNIRKPDSLEVEVGAQALPNQRLIDWLQAASPRVPADLVAQGSLAGRFTYQPQSSSDSNAGWDGKLLITSLSLKSSYAGLQPITIGDLALQSGSPQPDSSQSGTIQLTSLQLNSLPRSRHAKPTPSAHTFRLEPTTLDLGGETPATLDGSFDRTGYTLHLTGMIVLSRLTALGNTIPQLGDGLKEVLPTNRAAGPVRLDLTATRPWGGPQTWQDNALHPAPTHPRHRPR